MAFVPDHIIEDAVDVVLTTRDFCGNETEAVRDFAIENGFKADWKRIASVANFRANARWRQFQKAAGVPEKHLW
jgi:hypothetical protein